MGSSWSTTARTTSWRTGRAWLYSIAMTRARCCRGRTSRFSRRRRNGRRQAKCRTWSLSRGWRGRGGPADDFCFTTAGGAKKGGGGGERGGGLRRGPKGGGRETSRGENRRSAWWG